MSQIWRQGLHFSQHGENHKVVSILRPWQEQAKKPTEAVSENWGAKHEKQTSLKSWEPFRRREELPAFVPRKAARRRNPPSPWERTRLERSGPCADFVVQHGSLRRRVSSIMDSSPSAQGVECQGQGQNCWGMPWAPQGLPQVQGEDAFWSLGLAGKLRKPPWAQQDITRVKKRLSI